MNESNTIRGRRERSKLRRMNEKENEKQKYRRINEREQDRKN
jgi:hypothetical protein